MGYDIVNGDADGLCALHMLRLATPAQRTLITGVKRDVALLERVPPAPGLDLLVLDISLDTNHAALRRLLDDGARVQWYDHHSADLAPTHPGLHLVHDGAPDVCTSVLVDRQQGGRHRPWAVVAAFGDNLAPTARALAAAHGIGSAECATLAQLGHILNYNAYGETEADLHIAPAALYQALHACPRPADFVHGALYQRLEAGYRDDCARLQGLAPHWQRHGNSVYLLPAEAWARRASGVLANRLAASTPGASCAVVLTRRDGDYVISVRSAQPATHSASALCRQFDGGGGRAAAAGVNRLPAAELARFIACFDTYFSGTPGHEQAA
ncbi:hypothetical protein GTP38_25115 [Duganella sp. FT94W]|uniref:Acetyltransferase n=1 Tax=Duganella lactea TaxID=2692173 RepID=A0ABW9VDQ0_9BURK|nr:hypothetical protein [Duganella lactea]MYM37610.1 hypothetical protein [Duganella lactea]